MLKYSTSSKLFFGIFKHLLPKEKSNVFIKCYKFTNTDLQQCRIFHTSYVNYFLYEKDRKSGYDVGSHLRDDKTTIENVKFGFQILKREIKVWKEEVKERFRDDPVLCYRPGEVDIKWLFDSPESLELFQLGFDSQFNEGFSTCSLQMSKAGRALFSGNLSTQIPKDGKLRRAGYCGMRSMRNLKSFMRDDPMDWTQYNTLVLKVRGDGRGYMVNLSVDGQFDITWNDMYHYTFHTRGGPYWQITHIPFSKFFFGSKGRIQDKQFRIPAYRITHLGIAIADKVDAPFALEIEYIGLVFDPMNSEDFAYESYKTDYGIVGV